MKFAEFKKAIEGGVSGDEVTFDWNGQNEMGPRNGCDGKLSINKGGSFYICSSQVADGNKADDRLGYPKSWFVGGDNSAAALSNLKLTKNINNLTTNKMSNEGNIIERLEIGRLAEPKKTLVANNLLDKNGRVTDSGRVFALDRIVEQWYKDNGAALKKEIDKANGVKTRTRKTAE